MPIPAVPSPIVLTPYQLAQRYIGVAELSQQGTDHPLIQYWLSLCGFSLATPDEVAWCSAFVNGMCWELRLARSKSAAARSWLNVGVPITLSDASPGFDLVVLKRGDGVQPGPDVITAPGHVGFFAGLDGAFVLLLAGNQGNQVCIRRFPIADILGIRRLV